MIKDMLLLLKENRDLIATIRKILQVFPEGVIIQELDEKSQKYITKYANSSIRKEILNMGSTGSHLHLSDSSIKVKSLDGPKFTMNISDFLEMQSSKLEGQEENKSIQSMVTLVEPGLELTRIIEAEEDHKYYNIKSMKVNWDKTAEAYMHIFIDTTSFK